MYIYYIDKTGQMLCTEIMCEDKDNPKMKAKEFEKENGKIIMVKYTQYERQIQANRRMETNTEFFDKLIGGK